MSSVALPKGVVRVPLTRAPFGVENKKNSFYVAIKVLPPASVTSPAAAAGPDTARTGTGSHVCQVDTGSCGIVVPQTLFYVDGNTSGSLLPGVTKGSPAKVIYHPSSNDLNGFHYTVERLGVGVLDDGSCAFVCENATVIGAENVGPDQGMMGVGFGRPELGTNVFLNVPGMSDGTVPPSFLLTTQGIWLGYDKEDLPNASAFAFQTLTPETADGAKVPNTPAWNTPNAVVTLSSLTNPASGQYPGTGLLDTGLDLMMLRLTAPDWQQNFPGTAVTIAWGNAGSGAVLQYQFIVGPTEEVKLGSGDALTKVFTVSGPSSMKPMYIVPLGEGDGNFVNTGINVIQGADYYFNADLGLIGFAQTPG
ncbi:hypothetical protein [Azospirillum doebereinerae]|uniref:Peptidase A1 domain-containing protein n=1 Tax=Azospirillum doebereinerae TaxID=92933 RepID=A0A3S0WXE4_9PROT|nr:hypothetical protein [Azospirillum doebereinerae]MCG5243609.1 hypothetical protein [Azospirillum doebereinerae]RUQ67600.1 hypothetical protein EJ913_20495 [Azospirillum doebereinerae]